MTTFSTYEAKARFSEVLRLVREGKSVYITYRGETVAEIRPFAEPADLGERLRRLEEEGVVERPRERKGKLRVVAQRPGALERFLSDRDS